MPPWHRVLRSNQSAGERVSDHKTPLLSIKTNSKGDDFPNFCSLSTNFECFPTQTASSHVNVFMLLPKLKLPSQLPVMVLSGCNLLPHGLLPLFIFEPRYRKMLEDVLNAERMFAIGTADVSQPPISEEEPAVFQHSCVGMVRACVGDEDGSSHLILQGIQRIRFNDWHETGTPYRVAEIEPMPTINEDAEASAVLAQRAIGLARNLVNSGAHAPSSQALEEIEAIEDPEPLADLIAYHLIRDPARRQELLGINELGERLRYVINQLINVGPSLP
ncbi:MAG: Lon protease-like protein [Verrucomicrobiales bacterium]|jgi:Lon protease-like protein